MSSPVCFPRSYTDWRILTSDNIQKCEVLEVLDGWDSMCGGDGDGKQIPTTKNMIPRFPFAIEGMLKWIMTTSMYVPIHTRRNYSRHQHTNLSCDEMPLAAASQPAAAAGPGSDELRRCGSGANEPQPSAARRDASKSTPGKRPGVEQRSEGSEADARP